MRVCKTDLDEYDYDNYYYSATDDPDIIEVREKADWEKTDELRPWPPEVQDRKEETKS